MNKKLTPLRALKELKERYGKNFSVNDDERCRIIEKSLKSQEQYVQMAEKEHEDYMALCGEITRLKNKYKKQEKALEIIKERQVDIYLLAITKDVYQYNRPFGEHLVSLCRLLTKGEYDFLKEVLYEDNK